MPKIYIYREHGFATITYTNTLTQVYLHNLLCKICMYVLQ